MGKKVLSQAQGAQNAAQGSTGVLAGEGVSANRRSAAHVLASRPKMDEQHAADWEANVAARTAELKQRYADILAASRNVIEPTFEQLTSVIFGAMYANGFWEPEQDNIAAKLALVHSELSEALEYARQPDGFSARDDRCPQLTGVAAELADAMIRIFDIAGRHQINLGEAVVEKMTYNLQRPYKHNKQF